ncbi:MAG: carboxymuconolactone decarboxylase family protein [Acidimicrobiales bacterium]
MPPAVKLLEEEEMSEDARAVMAEIRSTLRIERVPDFFRALAYRPEQMRAVWSRISTLMDPRAEDHKLKHLIALGVCSAVGSSYFCAHHAGALRREGATEAEIAEVLQVAELWSGLSTLAFGLGLEFEG